MSFSSIEEEVIYNKLVKNDNNRINESSDTVAVSVQIKDIYLSDEKSKSNDYLAEISQRIETMENNKNSYPEYRMPEQPFYRPIKKIRYVAKKIIRKSLNWALESAYERQVQFNSAVVPSIGRLTELQANALSQLGTSSEHINRINEQIVSVRTQSAERIAKFETQVDEVRKETEQFTGQINQVEVQIEAARKETEQFTGQINQVEVQIEAARKETEQFKERLETQERKLQILEQWFAQSAKMIQTVNESVKTMEEQGILKQTSKIKTEDEAFNLAKRTLSQSGEDVILAYILNARGIAAKDCTYLDLGANHAKQYSNTYYFYDKGARGVLVEANPSLILN